MDFDLDAARRDGAVLALKKEDLSAWITPVLFTPPLTWCVLSLLGEGVERVAVRCAPQVWEEVKDLLPADSCTHIPEEEDAPGAVLAQPALFFRGAEPISLGPDPAGRAAAAQRARETVNRYWLTHGVDILDPCTVYISPTVTIEEGTTLLPGTILRGNTHIGKNCEIGPNTMLTDVEVGVGTVINSSQASQCTIGSYTNVGPFAYIRPDTHVGDHVKVGDFVELKNSTIGDDTKISHLTYVGDSDVGEGINFGCGTVTVNYDGHKKFRTTIGSGAFIGCNTNLVAPVSVGEGAYIAAGSTITQDVPPDSLAIARSQQTVKNQWAKKRREKYKK